MVTFTHISVIYWNDNYILCAVWMEPDWATGCLLRQTVGE